MLKVLVTILYMLAISVASMFTVPVYGQQGGDDQFFIHNTVRVINDLGKGSSLSIHCYSKDDDLGLHVLANGQFTEWSFKNNIGLTTLFWCNIKYSYRGYIVIKSFDAFKAKKELYRCSQRCWRSIRTDGIYFYVQYKNYWEKEYAWG